MPAVIAEDEAMIEGLRDVYGCSCGCGELVELPARPNA
jgi:hypothetical protein